MGPFETIELNAPGGIADYCARYRRLLPPHSPPIRRRRPSGTRRTSRASWTAWAQVAVDRARSRAAPPGATGAWRRSMAHKRAQPEQLRLTRGTREPWPSPAKSSSPAPSPARSTRRRCRRICRSRRRRSPTRRSARRRPARRSCTCMRATRRTAGPTSRPEAFAPFLQVIKQRSNCVINITTGGAPTMTVEERLQPGAHLQAGGRLAQHGLDELRPLPDARTATRSSSTTGSGPISRARATASSRTPSRTSSTS